MKGHRLHIRNLLVLYSFFLAALLLCSCSDDSGSFKIDARFLNMNQASFYVYSPDGAIDGIDTINVQAGRFTYKRSISQEGTIVIVFPNYTTMPVFVEPGADISIEANAAHLRGMEITGTKVNKLYTKWRKNCEGLSPEEMRLHAALFIGDHPASPVSRWLLMQHFVLCPKPDIPAARQMLRLMLAATDNNIHVARMQQSLSKLGTLPIGKPLPRFTAKDIDGKAVPNGQYLKGTAVICLWTSWNYDSKNMLRQIANHQRHAADSLRHDHVLTICLDPSVSLCRKTLKECNAEELTTICDTLMWESPLIKTLGMNTLPDNIRLKDGKVTARHIPTAELLKK